MLLKEDWFGNERNLGDQAFSHCCGVEALNSGETPELYCNMYQERYVLRQACTQGKGIYIETGYIHRDRVGTPRQGIYTETGCVHRDRVGTPRQSVYT